MIRLIVVLVVVVAAAFFLVGYWMSGTFRSTPAVTGIETPRIDTGAAREAMGRVGTSLEEGGLTAKIKAKMVLDDMVKARNIDVTTEGGVVTLSGTVHSESERERAVALARETDGVTNVIDRLVVRRI